METDFHFDDIAFVPSCLEEMLHLKFEACLSLDQNWRILLLMYCKNAL